MEYFDSDKGVPSHPFTSEQADYRDDLEKASNSYLNFWKVK